MGKSPERGIRYATFRRQYHAALAARRRAEAACAESVERCRDLFEYIPIALWEEDLSAVKMTLDTLRDSGVRDLQAYFDMHPQDLMRFASLVKICDVNEASVAFFHAKRKEEIIRELPPYFNERSLQCFRDQLISLAEGNLSFSSEIPILQPGGGELLLALSLAIMPRYRDTWERVLVTFSDITDRARVENALRESETKYRTLFNVEPDALILVDIETQQILDANEAAVQLYGYSREEFLALRITDVSADPAATLASIKATKLRQIEYVPLRYYLRKDGTKFPVELSARTFELSGRIVIFAAFRDITERLQVEETLRLSEERFRELAQLAPVGIFLGNARGEVTYVNQRWSDITGWPPEHGLGIDWMAGIHPDDRAYVERERESSFRAQREILLEYRYLTPDGVEKWIVVNVRPLLNAQGVMTAFIGTVLDITARKRAEERVQQLLSSVELWAAEMDATITAIADGVIIFGRDAVIIRINRAAEQILGYTTAITELPFTERLLHLQVQSPEGAQLTLEELPPMRALQGETIQGMVLAFTRGDGQQRWVSVSAAPIPSPEGNILGAVMTFSDITPLRDLQQRQEDLLHIVSHDLRLPLTIIHGHMELLEEALLKQRLDGELEFNTSTIDRNVHRLNVMIQDLVDMARLESHQFLLDFSAVTLQAYIPDFLHRLLDILPVHRVTVDIPADLPPVKADFNRLERILQNLLTNAFKYSAEETPVHIRAVRQDHEVVIAMSDQGYGIAPEHCAHLFERFYRIADRKAEGLGLGLYITKMLVEAHEGRIWLESAVGKGSTFFFTLPLATSPTERLQE